MPLTTKPTRITKSTATLIDNIFTNNANKTGYQSGILLPPQGFGPEATTRGAIVVSPAYTHKECVKYCCSMRINPVLKKLGAHGGPG